MVTDVCCMLQTLKDFSFNYCLINSLGIVLTLPLEFPNHTNVSKIHQGSCCQQQGFPAERSQVLSCSKIHNTASTEPGSLVLLLCWTHGLCCSCNQCPLWRMPLSTSIYDTRRLHVSRPSNPVYMPFLAVICPSDVSGLKRSEVIETGIPLKAGIFS